MQRGIVRRSGLITRERTSLRGPESIKLLIVDEEPSVRSELTKLCSRFTDVEILGQVGSGQAAIDAAQSMSPDVMLIEVALPDMSGFDVLRLAANSTGSLGIMTSQQADHVAQAMAEGAVDYLVKPVSVDRFAQSIERVRQRYVVEQAADEPTILELLRLLRRPPTLIGERQRRFYPLEVEKVDYIEADGNYVDIHVGDDEYLSRDSLKRLATKLADFGFVRIDRSILLNIRAVHFAEPIGNGTLAITLSTGACLHSSKRYRESIFRVLPLHQSRGRTDFQ